jgi:dihydrofolate reductase
MIVAIVAHDYDRVIGKGNELPWQLPEDLKLFKKHTTGHVVVMGRKTWESIPEKYRPLPNRYNIVISRDEDYGFDTYDGDGPMFVPSYEQAILQGRLMGEHIFIIGGASIYDYALNQAKPEDRVDRILLSLVDGVHEGDVFFPELNGTWADVHVSEHDGFELIEKIRYETCIPVDGR